MCITDNNMESTGFVLTFVSLTVFSIYFLKCMLQALATETLGKTKDFQAVPGCGLVCHVSNVEQLITSSMSDLEIMNRRNSTSSFKVMVDGIEADQLIPLQDLGGVFDKLNVSAFQIYSWWCILCLSRMNHDLIVVGLYCRCYSLSLFICKY